MSTYEEEEQEEQSDRRGGRRRRGGEFWGAAGGEKKRREVQPDTCWFCLSNIGAEKHLVISVGTSCYMAMPKGSLIQTT